MSPKTYLTKPSNNGRFFLQYYPDDRPSLVNFSKIITSGYLGPSNYQTLEIYNRMDLFASNPLAKSAINRENLLGDVSCSTTRGYTTCSNCCRTTSTYLTCGCIGPNNNCIDCKR
jgi:hypothetical protein